MNLHFHTDDQLVIATVRAFLEEWNNPLSYFEVKTSGSTGTPKTIRIEKKHARASAKMTGNYLNLQSGQTALLCLSPDTIAGKMMIVRSVEFNLELCVVAPSANPLAELEAEINFVALVPYQLQRVLADSPGKLTDEMQIIVGGGPVSNDLEKQIRGIPSRVYHSFGMTETISHIALRDVTARKKAFDVLPGITVSENQGRLNISAPHLGIDHMETNDCISIDYEGEFIWRGRLDFVVISGGVKIHPEEVENALAGEIEAPYFVLGEPDEELGEKLVLCIESAPFQIEKKRLSKLLPKYHVPKTVYFFPRFVYTKSGKINRLATLDSGNLHEAPLL